MNRLIGQGKLLDTGSRPNIVDVCYRFLTDFRSITEPSPKIFVATFLHDTYVYLAILFGYWKEGLICPFIARIFRAGRIMLSSLAQTNSHDSSNQRGEQVDESQSWFWNNLRFKISGFGTSIAGTFLYFLWNIINHVWYFFPQLWFKPVIGQQNVNFLTSFFLVELRNCECGKGQESGF